jgi:hypothetical protein
MLIDDNVLCSCQAAYLHGQLPFVRRSRQWAKVPHMIVYTLYFHQMLMRYQKFTSADGRLETSRDQPAILESLTMTMQMFDHSANQWIHVIQ